MLRADTPRHGVVRRARRGGQSEREEKYVSVFPHWWYIRCKIRRVTTRARRAVYADAPCKLSRTVSSGTARYVIRPRTPNSLHGGALPVVVLFAPAFARICSLLHINARGCTSLAKRRRRGSPSLFFLFLSHLLFLFVTLSLLGGASCFLSAVFLPSCRAMS